MKILGIVAVDVVRDPENFQGTICMAHCAVIFARAQLSCIYRPLIVTFALGLPSTVSEILPVLYARGKLCK